MDPSQILTAANTLSLPSLALVVAGGLIFAVVKVIGWGQEVTKLLGNHLRHDLGDLKEEMRGTKRASEDQTLILREQTLIIRAVGVQIRELVRAIDSHQTAAPKMTTTVTQQVTKEQTLNDILDQAR